MLFKVWNGVNNGYEIKFCKEVTPKEVMNKSWSTEIGTK